MDFTREPVIETVITPKEGCKLVIRSSRGVGHEEFFVDAVEVVSFGNSFFFRSMERPKSFIVPVSDYEILEVRETRLILKAPNMDKAGKSKDNSSKSKDNSSDKNASQSSSSSDVLETKVEKKRDKRRSSRRRRVKEEKEPVVVAEEPKPKEEELVAVSSEKKADVKELEASDSSTYVSPSLNQILPPPETLISDSIGKYRESDLYRDAFYDQDESVATTPDQGLEETVTAEDTVRDLMEQGVDTLGEETHLVRPSEEISILPEVKEESSDPLKVEAPFAPEPTSYPFDDDSFPLLPPDRVDEDIAIKSEEETQDSESEEESSQEEDSSASCPIDPSASSEGKSTN